MGILSVTLTQERIARFVRRIVDVETKPVLPENALMLVGMGSVRPAKVKTVGPARRIVPVLGD